MLNVECLRLSKNHVNLCCVFHFFTVPEPGFTGFRTDFQDVIPRKEIPRIYWLWKGIPILELVRDIKIQNLILNGFSPVNPSFILIILVQKHNLKC